MAMQSTQSKQIVLNGNHIIAMSSKDVFKSGETGGRRAAIRDVFQQPNQELMPSQLPLPKPTRDINSSNRSHSIIHQEGPISYSDRRIVDRDAEEFEYQRQANIVYNKQFKSLAKLLGNEGMDFDELKQKVEILISQESSKRSESDLRHKIQILQREINRKEEKRSTHSLGTDYLKTMEAQLSRRNRLINELSESVKKEDFDQAYRELEAEVQVKDKQIRQLEEQLQEARVRSSNQMGSLEEEIIKRSQQQQKISLELDTVKRKLQAATEENERAKKREKELAVVLESQSKATYQGVTYSTNSLLLQLQTRDKELSNVLEDRKYLEEQKLRLKQQINRYIKDLELQQVASGQYKANLQYNNSLVTRQSKQLEQLRQELNQSKVFNKQYLQQQRIKNNEAILQFQNREKALVEECRHLQTEINSQIQRNEALKEQITELSKQSETDGNLVFQLNSLIKEQKNKYQSALSNFQIMREKYLEEIEVKARIETLLQDKEELLIAEQQKYNLLRKETNQKETLHAQQQTYLITQIKDLACQLETQQANVIKMTEMMEIQRQQYKKVEEQSHQLSTRNTILQSQLSQSQQKILQLEIQQKQQLQLLKHQLLTEATEQYQTHIKEIQRKLFSMQYQIQDKDKQIQQLTAQLAKSNNISREKQNEVTQLEKQLNTLKIAFDTQQQELKLAKEHTIIIQEYQEQLKIKEQLERQQISVKAELAKQKDQRQKLEEKLLKLQTDFKIKQEQIVAFQQKIISLTQTINQQQQKIAITTQIIQQHLADKEKLIADSNSLQVMLEQKQHQQQQLEEEYNSHRMLLEQKHQEFQSAEQEIIALQQKIQNQEQSLQKFYHYQQKLVLLEEEIQNHQEEETRLRTQLEEQMEKENSLGEHIQTQNNQLQELKEELSLQKERNDKEREQLTEKLQIINEQLERERLRWDQEQIVRNQLELELLELQKLEKNSEMDRHTLQIQLTQLKTENSHLQAIILNTENSTSTTLQSWSQQKQSLLAQISTINAQLIEAQANSKSLQDRLKADHSTQINQIHQNLNQLQSRCLQLQQQRQQLMSKISQLLLQKDQWQSKRTAKPSLQHQLDESHIKYLQNKQQQLQVNDTPNKEKEELMIRIQELEHQVELLRSQLETKQDLIYSKSQEEESLKLMLSSVQAQKTMAEKQIERLRAEEANKEQKETLSENQQLLKQNILTLQQALNEKQKLLLQIKQGDGDSTELILLKHNYALTRQDLQQKNELLMVQLNKFQQQMQSLLSENKLFKTESNSQKQRLEQQVRSLQHQIQQYQLKEQTNQQLVEINKLLEEITTLKVQIEKAQHINEKLSEARGELQIRNQQLQNWNRQLETLLKSQKDEDHKILSKLSKKSNISQKQYSKKENSFEESPSSDGELSRKILNYVNYDPSKISGQESKFSPHLVFENSKIHVRQNIPSLEPQERLEIKEQRNQESVLSKTLQERERYSEASKRETPKDITISQDMTETKKQPSSIQKKESRASNNITSEKKYSMHSNKSSNSHHSSKVNPQNDNRTLEQQTDRKRKQSIQAEAGNSEGQNKKEEYLPQHSSKKTIQSNESKKKVKPEEEISKEEIKHDKEEQNKEIQLPPSVEINSEHKNDNFQKKIHIGTIPPIYIARPTPFDPQTTPRREQSGSRSNSRSKITISYGNQVERSVEINSSRANIANNPSDVSKNSSRVSEARKIINTNNEISPISIRRPQAYQQTNQSLKSSMFRQEQNSSKMKESIVQLIAKGKSESVVNKNEPVSIRFSTVISGKMSPPQCSQIQKQLSPKPVAPKIQISSSPRSSNIIFNTVKSPTSLGYSSFNNKIPSPPFNTQVNVQQKTLDLQKKAKEIQAQKKQTVEQTPMKINMKKVSNGKKINTASRDSVTFGARSGDDRSDSIMSLSSDSGIEILQNSWIAPCCKPEP